MMRPPTTRPPARRVPLSWWLVPLLIVGGMAVMAAVGLAAPVCTTTMPDLWPKYPFPSQLRFHPAAEASLAGVPKPLDSGALRVGAGGCVEIMWTGGAEGYYWVPYDPADGSHGFYSNAYHRYSRGVSHGHGHGLDSEVDISEKFRAVYGRWPTEIEQADHWWVDGKIYELLAAWRAVSGIEVPPCAAGCVDKGLDRRGLRICKCPSVDPPPPPPVDPPVVTPPPPPVCPPPATCAPPETHVPAVVPPRLLTCLDALAKLRGLVILGAGRQACIAEAREWLRREHYVPGPRSSGQVGYELGPTITITTGGGR